jgi:prepilin-type N-terminal cleavage/methylation domain-containing protein
MKSPAYTEGGFTLLELSIVLVLIGVIIGGGLMTFTASVQATQFNKTVERMDNIEKALLNFAVANNRIPCPADLTLTATGSANYGLEAGAGSGSAIGVATGACTGTGMLPKTNFIAASGTAEGGVPTRALQLPDDYMYDGWGRKFRYAADPAYTKTAALPVTASNPCAVVSVSASAITVNDATGAARTTAGIYAIISHGANGHGAYTSNGVTLNAGSSSANELTNCHCTGAGVYTGSYTPTYVEKAPAYDSGEAGVAAYYFDDIVTFKEPWQMQAQNFPLTASTAQCVYVPDQGNNRVQVFSTSGDSWLGSISGTSSACTSCMCTTTGTACPADSGSGNGQIYEVGGAAIDTSGNLWVTDLENQRVEEFSSSGTYLSQFSANVSGVGGANLGDIALDSSGNVWVTDWANNRVLKYTSNGTFLLGIGAGYQGVGGSIGSAGSANGQFADYIFGIAVDSSNNVWVVESSNERVQKFNSSGSWLLSIGGPSPYTCETSPAGSVPACATGSGNGQFNSPYGIAIDSGGNIWVSDYYNTRVQKFNSSGVYQSQFNTWAGGSGAYSPGALAFDSSGNIWVFDNYSDNTIVEFNSSGSYLSKFGGTSGSGNGQFNGSPFGIAVGGR